MAENNKVTIINVLSEAMSSSTPETTKEKIQEVIRMLQIYLDSLETFYNNLEINARDVIDVYQEAEANETTISYALFKRLNKNDIEIEELLKNGYILLDQIRTFFTQEKIEYRVGVEYRGVLYENSLTLEELLQNFGAYFNTRSKLNNIYKLRAIGGKGSIKQILEAKEGTIITKVQDGSSLYSKIRRYTYLSNDSKQKNRGNAYEVYRRLLASRNGVNKIPPDVTEEEISNAFSEIRSNTASFLLGGDYLNQQIKFFAGAPSLVTTSSIRKNVQELINIFNSYIQTGNLESFKQRLKQMFIKDLENKNIADKAEEEARNKAIEEIDEIAKNFNITT